MQAKKLTGYLLTVFVVLSSNSFVASSAEAASAQQRIDQYTQEAENITSQRDQLKQQLVDLQAAMESAQNKDIPEKADLEAAQQSFDQYSEAYEQDPSQENQARLRNAEFKLHLAERKFRKANGELEELENEYTRVKADLTQLRQQLTSINEKIEEQKILAKKGQTQQKEMALRKAQAEKEAAKREVERLKAQLAEQEKPAPAAAPKKSEKILVASTRKEPVAVANDTPMELDDNFFLLTTAEQVEFEKGRLEDKLSGRAANLRTNKILNIRHFINGAEDSKTSHRFKGLGNYQFRAEGTMAPGENHVRVSFDRWTVTIPDALRSQEYVFLMDASSRSEPRIVCYPVSLD